MQRRSELRYYEAFETQRLQKPFIVKQIISDYKIKKKCLIHFYPIYIAYQAHSRTQTLFIFHGQIWNREDEALGTRMLSSQ
jgi:hypothetical protein